MLGPALQQPLPRPRMSRRPVRAPLRACRDRATASWVRSRPVSSRASQIPAWVCGLAAPAPTMTRRMRTWTKTMRRFTHLMRRRPAVGPCTSSRTDRWTRLEMRLLLLGAITGRRSPTHLSLLVPGLDTFDFPSDPPSWKTLIYLVHIAYRFFLRVHAFLCFAGLDLHVFSVAHQFVSLLPIWLALAACAPVLFFFH